MASGRIAAATFLSAPLKLRPYGAIEICLLLLLLLLLLALYVVLMRAFGALTLLIGGQEEHPACKN